MAQLVAFRNAHGDIGFMQRDGNDVCYFVNSQYPVSGANDWQAWVGQIEAGYASGSKELISKEAVSYYLLNYAESINVEIIEMAEVQRPGCYYSRISKENILFPYVDEQFLQDVRAYQNIQSSLDILFNYIEPSARNMIAYGHKIRELLILSCTEVECLLVKTLTDNGYEQKDRYSTNDYVKCKGVLRLDMYEVELTQHPTLKFFKPFRDWSAESPTKTLPWYNAYNSVKHNRIDNIADANLENLLDAISAIHVLLESQYGKGIFHRWYSQTEDRSIFRTVVFPLWGCHEVTAPKLIAGNSVKANWTEQRKYFEDYPL